MDSTQTATIVAKLEVSQQYMKDGLDEIKGEIRKYFEDNNQDRKELREKVQRLDSELAVARKMGNWALGLASGAALLAIKAIFGL
jgi:hypothetical protein